ncbi:MAG: hypothetical protein AB1757_14525 [Acidobacteriota bacterium]
MINRKFAIKNRRFLQKHRTLLAGVWAGWLFFLLFLPMTSVITPNRVLAAPGDLVAGFGTNGVVFTDFAGGNDSAQAVAVTLTGKIIAAGSATVPGSGTDFALACYDENGNLDPAFGQEGKVTTDFFGANDGGRGIAIQLDGKIVVSGFTTNGSERQWALARFNPDGSLDTTFDQDGKVVLDLGSTSEAFKVAMQEDGKIVAVGDSRPQNSLEFTIVRLNPADGSLDNTFGTNGVVRIDFGNADRAIDLAIDNENIFVCGFAVKSATDSNFGIVRLNLANGSLNPAFDGDGKREIDYFGKQDGAQAISIRQPVAPVNVPHLIVGGNAINTGAEDFAVAALDFNGNLIPSLFDQGLATFDFNGVRDLLFDLDIQPDGDIVGAGWAGSGANFDLGITKWDRNGRLDSNWGLQGEYTFDTAAGGNNVAFDGIIYGANLITVGTSINPVTRNDDFTITQHENEKFVEFTKTASPDPAVEGDLITYTFTIKNLTDNTIDFSILDFFSEKVSFDQAKNPLWIEDPGLGIEESALTKTLTVRNMEIKEVILVLRAMSSGSVQNNAELLYKIGGDFTVVEKNSILAKANVRHEVTKNEITGVTRDGKNLNVTVNSTGATQSSAIAPNGFEPQAACPVVLFDGVEQPTKLDPDNPSTVLIVKKGFKRITPGQTVMIKVRLCSGIETDVFLYTRPQ